MNTYNLPTDSPYYNVAAETINRLNGGSAVLVDFSKISADQVDREQYMSLVCQGLTRSRVYTTGGILTMDDRRLMAPRLADGSSELVILNDIDFFTVDDWLWLSHAITPGIELLLVVYPATPEHSADQKPDLPALIPDYILRQLSVIAVEPTGQYTLAVRNQPQPMYVHSRQELTQLLATAYAKGFASTGEGYNGEINHGFASDEHYLEHAGRDVEVIVGGITGGIKEQRTAPNNTEDSQMSPVGCPTPSELLLVVSRVKDLGKWSELWFANTPDHVMEEFQRADGQYHLSTKTGKICELVESAGLSDRVLNEGLKGLVMKWEYQSPNWEPVSIHEAV